MNMKIKTIILSGVFVLLFTLSFITNVNSNETTTNAEISLSNQKIGWGIKKEKNHLQPDLGATNKKLIEKYNGIALGSNEKKYIYLTFDLGYEAGYTANILDALKENNAPATFFITAHYVNTAGDLVKRMIDEGHIIGNHTVNHKSMPDISDEELKKEVMTLHQSMYEKFGYEMKYLRPPKGEFSERTLSLTEELGYKTVMWSFAYVDWEENKQPSHDKALKTIMDNLHSGEIMLLHATSKTNSEIMSEMIQRIKQEGYEIRSLDNFIE